MQTKKKVQDDTDLFQIYLFKNVVIQQTTAHMVSFNLAASDIRESSLYLLH